MDALRFIEQFHDYLAPRLDTYEQAIYLYIFRHSRLLGKDEVVIGFKSERRRMACGIGQLGSPMSEGTAYEKLRSLQAKGCIVIVASERAGSRIRLKLPDEIPDVIPASAPSTGPLCLDDMDFFEVPENRTLILEREESQCFYCRRGLTVDSYVIEHVTSRPAGDNSYRNLVAACRECNNRKGSTSAQEFLRMLYRMAFLTAEELQNSLARLELLRSGELKPLMHKKANKQSLPTGRSSTVTSSTTIPDPAAGF